jgi:hypothetical protein
MMELHKKSILLNLVLLLLVCLAIPSSYGQCPTNCLIEVSIQENCQNGRTKLKAETQGEFLGWTTTNGDTTSIENHNMLSTYVYPKHNTLYIAKSKHIVHNQLINGSFDSDEQFFTTDYSKWDTGDFAIDNYTISQNSKNASYSFVDKADHTGNGGYMLIVDGSEDTSKSFFTQKIHVVEGKTYQIKMFAANIHINLTGTTEKSGNNSAKIGLFINNVYLKSKSLSHDTTWNEFTYSWKANFTGETSFTLKNKSSKVKENVFAIDDIFFGGSYIDSASIAVDPCSTISDVFSPDGDGQYDSYYITESGVAKIYNSAGKLVQSLQVPNHWDGKTSNGENAPTDYYSIIINGKKVKHVTLMR